MITDRLAAGTRSLEEVVRQALEGGADAIQLRDKKAQDRELVGMAKRLLVVTRPKGALLIVNDRIHAAKEAGADGVHLGQTDGTLAAARVLLGEEAIIGRSTHSLEQALEAEKEGFDYIGLGPVFPTPTKPACEPIGLETVRLVSRSVRIPFVAIGGIDRTNVRQVYEAGAKAVAVVRAVMGAEDPAQAARELLL